MATMELTKENFREVIENNDTVIIDFWASWCGPCKAFAPIFEAASEKHPDVVFAKVNTEEQRELAAAYRIQSIPTIMLLRQQILLYSQPGMLSAAQLDDLLKQARELDMDQVRKEIEEQESQQAQQGSRQA
ncbi:MAG TPA: thioredoxin [Chromatiales bacterium]|nr:thioredoxin [Chromatiales bacterium]